MSIIIVIVSSLISGIFGVIISIVYHRRYEKRKMKIDTLKNFVGYRYDIRGDEFTKTLNEIFIVFQDSDNVLQALKNFHETIISKQTTLANSRLLELFKLMCNNLNIETNKYSDSTFLEAFNVRNNNAN